MGRYVTIDTSELKTFFDKLAKAGQTDFKKELEKYLDAVGYEFLRILEDNFKKAHRNTGSGQLIASFTRDGKDNVWRYEDNGLSLEVGTTMDYASYVNDGHRTFDPAKTRHFKLKDGTLARFVPGYWRGNRFVYTPGAKSGMVLKFHWVEGLHFWEPTENAINKIFAKTFEKNLQQWLESYFRV